MEKLTDYEVVKQEYDSMLTANRNLMAEIERLQAENESLNNLAVYNASCCARLHKELFNAKSEAIKEFAERLKNLTKYYWLDEINIDHIDDLVKEMTEPVKIEHNSLCETETYIKE